MFEGLKKKLSHLIDSLASSEKKEEGKKGEMAEAHAASAEAKSDATTYQDNVSIEKEGREANAGVAEEVSSAGTKTDHAAAAAASKGAAHDINVTAGTKIKSAIFKRVTLSEKDISEFIDSLQTSLLEADVGYETTEKIIKDTRARLVSASVDSKHIKEEISNIVRSVLLDVLNKGSSIDIISMAEKAKGGSEPFKILFLGPNGAGKTTTIAKIAKMLLDHGMTCVLSASDTFRAAAIEQTAHHAAKLGVNVIKGAYGADPASIAFDAIAFARSHGINVVLIDSAGRQETNKSLMEEVKKMVRVAKPDLKIFVGESITGSALLDQVREFDRAVKLDGIILTKVDCDAKGGNTLSILSESSVPILFFGTGEGYSDIISYSPEFVIKNITAS